MIKKEAFQATLFIQVLMVDGTENWKKEFNELKNVDSKYYCSGYYDVSINRYDVDMKHR